MFSPCELEVLIHYCVSNRKHDRQDAPAVANACNRLCLLELLEPWRDEDAGPYRGTERGKVYLDMLCQLPPPKRAWLNQQGEIIHRQE